ncbi:MAG: nucleotidyltransferase family protein [Candidatus Binatia bacterium]
MAGPEVVARPVVSGIVLAAGSSTRMGRPKQLLEVGERSLLQVVLDEALRAPIDEIVVVLGHRADEIRAGLRLPAGRRVRVVVNPEHACGQSSSLRVGLRAASARADAAAILLGDQPGVQAEVVGAVVAAFHTTRAAVVRPVWTVGAERVPGHPVLLARRIWEDVARLEGDQGARALIVAHPEWVVEVPCEGAPPRDVDTWADYLAMIDGPKAEG